MSSVAEKKRAIIRKEGISYVHIEHAASLLDCSEQYVRAECDRGALRGRLVGGAWYIEEGHLAPYLRERASKSEKKRLQARTESVRAREEVLKKAFHSKRVVGSEIRRRP